MNHKQKFGYTALGAVIMLIGIGAGSIVSPPLIAQRDGVFGEIECTRLTVFDKAGKAAILLYTNESGNHVVIADKAGKLAVDLTASENSNRVTVLDKAGKLAVGLGSTEARNIIAIDNKAGKEAVILAATEEGNDAIVFDKAGGIKWSTLSD